MAPPAADVGPLLEERLAAGGVVDGDREHPAPVSVGDGRAVVGRAVAAGLLPLTHHQPAVDDGKVGRQVEGEPVPDRRARREVDGVRFGELAHSEEAGLAVALRFVQRFVVAAVEPAVDIVQLLDGVLCGALAAVGS